jgi:twitching motility protein PilT
MTQSIDKRTLIEELNTWLSLLIEKDGTDLHIKSNAPAKARIKGDIHLLDDDKPIQKNVIKALVRLLTGDKYNDFKENKEFDGTYITDKYDRFRINIYSHYNGLAINFRIISQDIKTIEELNLPTALHKLAKLQRGLVLLTGTTGSGKSTLLASVIEEINRNHNKHIITIEDPIEFVYTDKKSIIEQRELGTHTYSFAKALRAAMREDPDIIVVGEIRDIDTAESILQAVNTGHLVFSTVHTLDAKETIDRMISIFPSNEQNRIRTTLAATIEAIISQRLIKGVDNNMIPAVEMLFKSALVQELIRTERDSEILDVIEKEGHSYDSISFNQSLYNLTLAGKISEKKAYQYATNVSDLRLMFNLSEEYTQK